MAVLRAQLRHHNVAVLQIVDHAVQHHVGRGIPCKIVRVCQVVQHRAERGNILMEQLVQIVPINLAIRHTPDREQQRLIVHGSVILDMYKVEMAVTQVVQH